MPCVIKSDPNLIVILFLFLPISFSFSLPLFLFFPLFPSFVLSLYFSFFLSVSLLWWLSSDDGCLVSRFHFFHFLFRLFLSSSFLLLSSSSFFFLTTQKSHKWTMSERKREERNVIMKQIPVINWHSIPLPYDQVTKPEEEDWMNELKKVGN